MSRSARDRFIGIQTAIAKVYAYRPALGGEHSAMRNFLIHEYPNIDAAVVEDVIANDLDPLAIGVAGLLDAEVE